MNDHLKQFIDDHREDFDEEEPSGKIWDKIQEQVLTEKKEEGLILKMNPVRWSAAAVLILFITGGLWFIFHKSSDKPIEQEQTIAKTNQIDTLNKSNNSIPDHVTTDSNEQQKALASTKDKKVEPKSMDVNDDPQADVKEEMVHYAKLIEIKQRELKSIQKEEPLLYKKFSGDVNKLDSVYHELNNQLSTNHNSEELLEAMIQNLQLQMGLLNHQLEIIKKINHSKKTVYEKAYQSI